MPCLSASAGRSAEGLTANGIVRLRRTFNGPTDTSPLPLSLASLWRGRNTANGVLPRRFAPPLPEGRGYGYGVRRSAPQAGASAPVYASWSSPASAGRLAEGLTAGHPA